MSLASFIASIISSLYFGFLITKGMLSVITTCFNKIVTASAIFIPSLLNVGNKEVSLKDYYLGELVLVSPNRLRYVGNNRWLQNVIYCAIGDDNYLYFKSSNPQYQALEKVNIRGIFEDPIAAAKLSCDNSSNCDILDMEIPLEDTLVAKLIEGVIQFVSSGLYKPQDKDNNAADDLSSLMTFIRNNMKSNLQRQIEG